MVSSCKIMLRQPDNEDLWKDLESLDKEIIFRNIVLESLEEEIDFLGKSRICEILLEDINRGIIKREWCESYTTLFAIRNCLAWDMLEKAVRGDERLRREIEEAAKKTRSGTLFAGALKIAYDKLLRMCKDIGVIP